MTIIALLHPNPRVFRGEGARDSCFEPAGSEGSSGIEVAASATKRLSATDRCASPVPRAMRSIPEARYMVRDDCGIRCWLPLPLTLSRRPTGVLV
jgi:hypothetical protein